jgi:hypothetical protein
VWIATTDLGSCHKRTIFCQEALKKSLQLKLKHFDGSIILCLNTMDTGNGEVGQDEVRLLHLVDKPDTLGTSCLLR